MIARVAGCIVSVLVLSLVTTARAQANNSVATARAVTGVVLASTGGAYQRLQGSVQLPAGASVLANPGGRGQVVYSETCVVDVVPGTIVWIEATPPCVANTQPAPQTQVASTAAAGGLGTAGTVAIVGGVAVLGGALALSGGGSSDGGKKPPPASP